MKLALWTRITEFFITDGPEDLSWLDWADSNVSSAQSPKA